jgi:hypothetical protein
MKSLAGGSNEGATLLVCVLLRRALPDAGHVHRWGEQARDTTQRILIDWDTGSMLKQ